MPDPRDPTRTGLFPTSPAGYTGGLVKLRGMDDAVAATAVARGAPSGDGLARAHDAVHEWCAANGHELTRVRWEIYGHWGEDQDPALFETQVYWLLA